MKEISQFMKRQVHFTQVNATIKDAVALFVRHHIGTLPVVDDQKQLIGVVYIHDLLELVMPSFVHLMDDFDYVRADFGYFEESQPPVEITARSVREIMQPPISVHANSGLLRTFALLNRFDMYDMPVVDEQDRLVGLVSRVDIGTALLANWHLAES